MRRRAQVAMEFIMTYGWAILVVLVAIGALAYFGVLSPGKYLPEKCIFTTGITCRDFQVKDVTPSTLELRFTIENGLDESMIVDVQNISVRNGDTFSDSCGPDEEIPWLNTVTIQQGLSQGFTCIFTGESPGAGTNVKLEVAINYSTSQGVYGKRAIGDISGVVQEE